MGAFDSRPIASAATDRQEDQRSLTMSEISSGIGRTTRCITAVRKARYVRVLCDGIAETSHLGPFIVILALAYGVTVAISEVKPDSRGISSHIADSLLRNREGQTSRSSNQKMNIFHRKQYQYYDFFQPFGLF